MPTQDFRSVIVTGVEDPDMDQARTTALALFESGLVSALTPPGHNFIVSFAVFPSGSGAGREAQRHHDAAICVFVQKLRELPLDFVVVHWSDNDDPEIADSHAQ